MAGTHRSFGSLRRLPSGRYQASHLDPNGRRVNAPYTFDTKGGAGGWLDAQRTDMARGEWRAPAPTLPTFADYAESWLGTRQLTPRTRDEYGKLLDGHVIPSFGTVALDDINPAAVRAWHAGLAKRTGPTRVAHAYGLLKAILATAVADDIIDRNPCRIRGGTSTKRARPIHPATLAELAVITENMRPCYQAAVLIGAWCGLRFGEVAELRRKDVDLDGGRLRIRRAVTVVDGTAHVGPPKSEAGVRDVAIPPHLIPALRSHLADHTHLGGEALLFPGPDGSSHLRSDGALHRDFYAARAAAGRPDLRFHDLRHTGATLAAAAGATIADLMLRIGHSTPGMAMRYQHASSDRDQVIAQALTKLHEADVVELRPAASSTRTPRRRLPAAPAD